MLSWSKTSQSLFVWIFEMLAYITTGWLLKWCDSSKVRNWLHSILMITATLFSVSQWLDFSQCYSSWIFLWEILLEYKKVKIIKTVDITVNIDFIQFSCFSGFISKSFVITEVVIVNSSLTFISHMPLK